MLIIHLSFEPFNMKTTEMIPKGSPYVLLIPHPLQPPCLCTNSKGRSPSVSQSATITSNWNFCNKNFIVPGAHLNIFSDPSFVCVSKSSYCLSLGLHGYREVDTILSYNNPSVKVCQSFEDLHM